MVSAKKIKHSYLVFYMNAYASKVMTSLCLVCARAKRRAKSFASDLDNDKKIVALIS